MGNDLRKAFGDIDIYLFDQLLRGRILPEMRVFDAGCGSGRNLIYFSRHGYSLAGVDADERALASARRVCQDGDFRCEPVESNSFIDAAFEVVLSSAVLHFARDEEHFAAMLRGSWRVLRSGGLFFCRLASSIGIESRVQPLGNGRYLLPDGSVRFLVNEALLTTYAEELGGELLDPLKTTLVQNQRSMTTWVMRKT